uniref:Uncharacterized protein n=1 Tax=Branchiostoma floridae TaxID=7739 RepID=C3XVA3_BRAFL|eukprot:XP_002612020.1 hypothetical protein BRAFLDRAFT_86991 [Branchiostoma floridae]
MWSGMKGSGSSSGAGSSGSGGARPPHDITSQQGLRQLYNSKVVHAEEVRRPLGDGKKMWGPAYHTGARVTLEDGSKWLVHKGPGFDYGNQTVVTDTKHMGGRWVQKGGVKQVQGAATVSDFVKAGGQNYTPVFNDCQSARDRMMKLPGKGKK